LPDAVLCKAVKEMEGGLIDADLAGSPKKRRGAAPGGVRAAANRTWLPPRLADGKGFRHGFPRGARANTTREGRGPRQFAGKVFLELSGEALSRALNSGVLVEVYCEQGH